MTSWLKTTLWSTTIYPHRRGLDGNPFLRLGIFHKIKFLCYAIYWSKVPLTGRAPISLWVCILTIKLNFYLLWSYHFTCTYDYLPFNRNSNLPFQHAPVCSRPFWSVPFYLSCPFFFFDWKYLFLQTWSEYW